MVTALNSSIPYATNTTATSSTASTGAAKVQQTKDQFLQLLIAQMKNQDPLSPADSNQFTNQMMQMGQLEQLFNLNDNMSSLVTTQTGAMIAQYAGMVGRKAQATGNQMQILQSDKGTMEFDLKSTPSSVSVNVFDSFGNLKRSFSANAGTGGHQVVSFDGKDAAGSDLADGYYYFTVEAADSVGRTIPVTTYSNATISGVRLESGTPIFQMGSEDVGISSITKIY